MLSLEQRIEDFASYSALQVNFNACKYIVRLKDGRDKPLFSILRIKKFPCARGFSLVVLDRYSRSRFACILLLVIADKVCCDPIAV
jgi:hypothetical protein